DHRGGHAYFQGGEPHRSRQGQESARGGEAADQDDAGRVPQGRAPLADPARPLRLQGAPAGMLSLPDRRPVRIPAQHPCPDRPGRVGRMEAAPEACRHVSFGQATSELRQRYGNAWRKHEAGEPLSPLEAQIVAVIEDRPEYRAAVLDDDTQRAYTPVEG